MRKVILFMFLAITLNPVATSAFYDEDSFWNSKHEQPAWFVADSNGGFFGETVGGIIFTQRPVPNDINLRLHKFVIGTAYFYISDRGIIRAKSDLSAVSIYLTLT